MGRFAWYYDKWGHRIHDSIAATLDWPNPLIENLRRPVRHKAQAWPYIDIVFLDECEDEADRAIYGCQSISTDETDAFFQAPVVPRKGETLTLGGDFQRRGAFVVEYTFCLL